MTVYQHKSLPVSLNDIFELSITRNLLYSVQDNSVHVKILIKADSMAFLRQRFLLILKIFMKNE